MSKHHLPARRNFLRALTSITGLSVAPAALAKATTSLPQKSVLLPTAPAVTAPAADKQLELYHLHTGESLSTTFFSEGQFIDTEMSDVNFLLRDHHNGKVFDMNPQLIELLYNVRSQLDTREPIQIISAYRSPETNAKLRQKSNKVAKKSLHMQGKAIDIRIPGFDARQIQQAALQVRGGGVGLYTRSDFVHLDVGRVRQWGK